MNNRTILSLAALVLSCAVLLHSLGSATASMPVGMQHGQFPFEHFTECDLPGATVHATKSYCTFSVSQNTAHTLLTVPNDRIFVVTKTVTDSDCNFISAGTPLVAKHFIEYYNSGLSGSSNIVLPAGSTLEVYLRNSTYCPFYIEGYYAHL